ncbi:helicase associated domain-containing protein [Antrihabitans spumae]|uniref:Helicase associated domain-containing protein n=1 Tax=Antrihabitans spumae TaxID=3373370 RepID=A0ABW7JWZ8_9NOCA
MIDSSKAMSSGDDGWQIGLSALSRFLEVRGSVLGVTARNRVGGFDLGRWIIQCRKDYWDGQLENDRVDTLEGLAGWNWGVAPKKCWRSFLLLLQSYVAENGTTVLGASGIVRGHDLDAWMSVQRKQYSAGTLTPSRAALLEAMPDWDWDGTTHRWQRGISLAGSFLGEHGHLDVARDYRVADSYPLGQWVHRCREDYRAGTLPAYRCEELESLSGWTWGRHQQGWVDGIKALRSFTESTGSAQPAQRLVYEGFRLGLWANERRAEYKRGSLAPERVSALEALPGWSWDPLAQKWREGWDALVAYSADRGHAHPTRTETFDSYPVGEWVRAQRTAYRNGRLSEDRRIRFESLPEWWWAPPAGRGSV